MEDFLSLVIISNIKHRTIILYTAEYREYKEYIYTFFLFLIGIHSMQGWTATTRHGVTRKRNTKRLRHKGNLFRKNLQLKDVC